MAFYGTSLGSPAMSIRAGVLYEQQTLSPDSGLFNISTPFNYNNWSFINSLPYQNARIKGNYSLVNNFEQGYFNFEDWNGLNVRSIDGTKSGYQGIGSAPSLANFWNRGQDGIAQDALYNYGVIGNFPSLTVKPKNITTAVVMSGENLGRTGIYPDMKLYIGSIPSGNITVYGRVGSVNPTYEYEDKILSFKLAAPSVSETITPGTEGPTFAGTGTDDGDIWSIWGGASSISSVGGGAASSTISGLPADTYPTNYLLATNFGFAIPVDAIIDGVEVTISRYCQQGMAGGQAEDNSIKIIKGGTISGTDIDTGAAWHANTVTDFQLDTIGGPTTLGGLTLTPTDVNASNFGVAIKANIIQVGGGDFTEVQIDYVKIKIYYHTVLEEGGGSGLFGSLTLSNKYDGNDRRLNWKLEGFGSESSVDMPHHKVTSREFSNFLMSYSQETGYGYFYTANDDEPFLLENVVMLGDISPVFVGETIFYEDSYANPGGQVISNPKIITDFGISNRLWSGVNIEEFDHHRLNGAYWLSDSPLTSYPSPSGSDNKSLRFHFPVNSSGTIGSCDSGNPTALNYYIPLNSGVNDRLFEFDRTQFNSTSLKLHCWVGNTGTNPSGYIGARIDFSDRSSFLAKDFFTPTHYWSGYPILINSGVHEIVMSGRVFNSSNNPSDLCEVSKNNSNNAQLYIGAWYNNIGRTYYGDIDVYSAEVKLDGFVRPPQESGQFTLVASGDQVAYSNIPLTIHHSHTEENTTLFIEGNDNIDNNCTLYISGGFESSSLDLYLKGLDSTSESTTLVINGGISYAAMPLHIYSSPPSLQSGSFPLSIWATNKSGTRDDFTLYIGEYASGVRPESMNLVLQGQANGNSYAAMNMFLESRVPSSNDGFTLVCNNFAGLQSGNINLFLQTKSGTFGAIPGSASMNLFLNREIESTAHNLALYLKTGETTNNNTTLFIDGANKTSEHTTLHIDGIGLLNETVKLYTNGF